MWARIAASLLQCPALRTQPHRTAFILRRKYPVPVKDGKIPQILDVKHEVYEVVEQTNNREKELLDLVLLDNVAGLGRAGDIVKVEPSCAYVDLILPKLAIYATEENVRDFSKPAVAVKFSSKYAQLIMQNMSHTLVPILMSKSIKWILQPWHVRVALRMAGIIAAESSITLPATTISGPSFEVEHKEFVVQLTINNTETVYVRCMIHFWEPERDLRLPFDINDFLIKRTPLFPEDKDFLNSLPAIKIKEETVLKSEAFEEKEEEEKKFERRKKKKKKKKKKDDDE